MRGMLRCTRSSGCQVCPPRSGSDARKRADGVRDAVIRPSATEVGLTVVRADEIEEGLTPLKTPVPPDIDQSEGKMQRLLQLGMNLRDVLGDRRHELELLDREIKQGQRVMLKAVGRGG